MSDNEHGYEVGDKVRLIEKECSKMKMTYSGMDESLSLIEKGIQKYLYIDKIYNDVYTLTDVLGSSKSCGGNKLNINVYDYEIEPFIEDGSYEQKGKELGALVDQKQLAYGNAVAQTYEVVKAFMTPYFNEENKTYTIPQSLLQHLLLQVRIIDKQNRIFNNPNGDLMSESPYGDLGGYGLLGANMIIDK